MALSLCGEVLGEGASRHTYVYNLDPKYVIKVETGNGGNNMVEYLLWEEVKGLTGNLEWVKNWFAPVKWISPNGKLLVMERTYEMQKKTKTKTRSRFLYGYKKKQFWMDWK